MDVLTGLMHRTQLRVAAVLSSASPPLDASRSTRHGHMNASTCQSKLVPPLFGVILVQHSDHLSHSWKLNFAEPQQKKGGGCERIVISQTFVQQ